MSIANLAEEVRRAQIGITRLMYVNQADSAVIGASSTAETPFDATGSIDGSQLAAGDVLHLSGSVIHTGSHTGAELTLKVYIGTEIVASGTFTIAAQNDKIQFDARIVVRQAHIDGVLAGQATFFSQLNTATSVTLYNKENAAEDLSGPLELSVTGQYNGSDADNGAVLKHFIVEWTH